jgi:hypothetical protein
MSSKNTFPFAGGLVFLGIQPLPVSGAASIALFASSRVCGSTWVRSILLWAPISSSVAAWPTMVLSEARSWARHYGFVGSCEGAYAGHETDRLSRRPGYLPSNRARSISTFERQVYSFRTSWWAPLCCLWLQMFGLSKAGNHSRRKTFGF